ncbi:MAG TPA: adenylate/guanylate cyclase domain-containing protein [Burkholderiales bacterium]|nr:adenylate/guanylate cyclase domain-containing protein [Burkholderiales bacterium]
MKCLRCQHENAPAQKFCGECGTALSTECTSCGASNLPAQKFCGQCGGRLGPGVLPSKFVSPQAYTPKHLAERILLSKEALEGERKQVTVLFADMKGSMELLAERDPEEARKLLDPVLERMMEAVHHYEGTVNQVMGDGVMALFGAPLALEDHAVRACYAALRMQEQVSRYGDELQRRHGAPIQLRVGVNSGEVVVRAIGSDLNMDYTAVGQTTHLAARMEQMAKPGTVLITADTLKLAEGYLRVRPLGPVPVKGLGEPIEVFELEGASSARTRLQASAVRGLTRFVGRIRELEVLAEALANAGHGKGQVVAIVGEPGVGKSRLFYEFTRSHRTQGWLLVEAGSVSYGKATPYLPIIDLLKSYFKIGERDDARGIREKVTGKLLTLDRALEPLLSPLLALLDQPMEDAQWQRLDPPQRRRQTLDALKRLWLREAQAQPLILVFEDLHWIDSETQEFLDGLLESVPTSRLLLLFNYRPEYHHRWGSKTYYTQLRLDSLTAETAEDLLTSLLGTEPQVEPLKKVLIVRTEGNPFFLEESVRGLVESGALGGERGSYRLLRALAGIEVPATVQAILAARIDRLQAEDKRLLQTAAVIGKDVPFALLQALAEQPEADLHGALSRLQAAEFLYEASLFPDLEYTFKHALTHDVAYASLLQERRRALHARIVQVIEALYADRLDEHAERLAHHAQRGQIWEKAVTYLRRAGQRAAIRLANRDAVIYFDQALAASAQLSETQEQIREAIDIRLEMRTALTALGDLERVSLVTGEAQQLAERVGDSYRLARALAYLTHVLVFSGQYQRALAAGEQALDLAATNGYLDVQVIARHYLGYFAWWRGRYDEGIELYQANIDALYGELELERLGMPALATVYAHGECGLILAEQGRFDEAERKALTAVDIARRATHPYSEVFAGYHVCLIYRRWGRFAPAIRSGEETLSLCNTTENRLLYPWSKMWLGYAYAESGRGREAIVELGDALSIFETIGIRAGQVMTTIGLGRAHLACGDVGSAVRLGEKGLQLAREGGERTFELWAARLLADACARSDSSARERAEQHYLRALSFAEELGARPDEAHCHLGLGQLYSLLRDAPKAREQLEQALALYRVMDMQHWPDEAEAALQALET